MSYSPRLLPHGQANPREFLEYESNALNSTKAKKRCALLCCLRGATPSAGGRSNTQNPNYQWENIHEDAVGIVRLVGRAGPAYAAGRTGNSERSLSIRRPLF